MGYQGDVFWGEKRRICGQMAVGDRIQSMPKGGAGCYVGPLAERESWGLPVVGNRVVEVCFIRRARVRLGRARFWDVAGVGNNAVVEVMVVGGSSCWSRGRSAGESGCFEGCDALAILVEAGHLTPT